MATQTVVPEDVEFIDLKWVFARFSCFVCDGLGSAMCTTHAVAVPDCPLGADQS
jgi:hypothetical protein